MRAERHGSVDNLAGAERFWSKARARVQRDITCTVYWPVLPASVRCTSQAACCHRQQHSSSAMTCRHTKVDVDVPPSELGRARLSSAARAFLLTCCRVHDPQVLSGHRTANAGTGVRRAASRVRRARCRLDDAPRGAREEVNEVRSTVGSYGRNHTTIYISLPSTPCSSVGFPF